MINIKKYNGVVTGILFVGIIILICKYVYQCKMTETLLDPSEILDFSVEGLIPSEEIQMIGSEIDNAGPALTKTLGRLLKLQLKLMIANARKNEDDDVEELEELDTESESTDKIPNKQLLKKIIKRLSKKSRKSRKFPRLGKKSRNN